jgi:hypothetical protein
LEPLLEVPAERQTAVVQVVKNPKLHLLSLSPRAPIRLRQKPA